MKKLYIALAAALLGTASIQARELTFYLGNQAITNGASVEFTEIEAETIGSNIEVYMKPEIYLMSDIQTSSVTVSSKSNLPVQMCAGGACVSGTEIVKENVKLDANKKLDIQFHYETVIPATESVPEVVTEFEAVDPRYPDTAKKFTLVMNPSAGVATIISDNDSFRAVAGGIDYSFAAPTAVELYSITGARVLATTLQGNGTLETSNLPKGIYVYTFAGKSGKIYLR